MAFIDTLLNADIPQAKEALRLAAEQGESPQRVADLLAKHCEESMHHPVFQAIADDAKQVVLELRAGLHNERIAALMGYV